MDMTAENKLRMVILDGYTTNPGDISWDALASLGELTVHDRTAPEEVLGRSKDAEVVFTNDIPFSRETMEALPNLKYIGVLATGYNIVDVKAAKELGIIVTNIPNYGTASVAQMAMGLLLALCHRPETHSKAVEEGVWTACPDYCFWLHPMVELEGKTLGIVGAGRIGRMVARMAEGFGMKVVFSAPRPDPELVANGYVYMSLDELMATCDVVSLHCPLTPDTSGMINKERIASMKPDAFLINVSRGKLVDEGALAEALNSGCIAGAGLDVLSSEPPSMDNPLIGAKNCIITPHIAWASKEARMRLIGIAADNVAAWTKGSPINVV